MIRFLLDTSICIELIRGRSGSALRRLKRRKVGSVGLSAISLAELRFGVAKSSDPERNLVALAHFCAPLEVCPFDDAATAAYGDVRRALERAGTPIGPLDTLIAAHAVALGAAVVTNNVREFNRVPNLKFENWLNDA